MWPHPITQPELPGSETVTLAHERIRDSITLSGRAINLDKTRAHRRVLCRSDRPIRHVANY
jgi:hypothetical protein